MGNSQPPQHQEQQQDPPESNNNTNDNKDTKKEETQNEIDIDSLPEYSMDEVEKHDKKENGVWIVLDNLVYDVTKFLPKHPGGAGFLLEVAGEDATQEFEASIHSESARITAREFLIGKLKQDKSKKKGLGLTTSFNPQTSPTKPSSKYPTSSNYGNNNNNNSNQSSSSSEST
eukprot:368052_1